MHCGLYRLKMWYGFCHVCRIDAAPNAPPCCGDIGTSLECCNFVETLMSLSLVRCRVYIPDLLVGYHFAYDDANLTVVEVFNCN